MKGTYLKEIIESTKTSISDKKKYFPQRDLESQLLHLGPTRGFRRNLIKSIQLNSLAVIAEIKKASPSKGLIRKNFEPEVLARNYEEAGATCLSVLTDQPYFQGSLDHLSLVKESVDLPLLRKDFIVDEYQIYESRYRGADCILLIVAALTRSQLKDYHDLARELNLDVLIEVHTVNETLRAVNINPNLIGINNRNLETFEVDLENTKHLVKDIPQEILIVSESGIKTREDVQKIYSYGVNIFLVGEAFMKVDNPGTELRNIFFP
tara:strand:+ start:396 stop:1190 length:795 start_codon:yes stop_codon:yes gene_type:complete